MSKTYLDTGYYCDLKPAKKYGDLLERKGDFATLNGSEYECFVCHGMKSIHDIKYLQCGHVVDLQCLNKLIDYYCGDYLDVAEIDKSKIFNIDESSVAK